MKIIIATDEGNFSRIFHAAEKQEIIEFLKEFCGIDLKDDDEVPSLVKTIRRLPCNN